MKTGLDLASRLESQLLKKMAELSNRTEQPKNELIKKAKSDQYDKARQRTFRLDEEDTMSEAYKRKKEVYRLRGDEDDDIAYQRMPKEERYGVKSGQKKVKHPLFGKMTASTLQQGIIFSEVLGKPKGY